MKPCTQPEQRLMAGPSTTSRFVESPFTAVYTATDLVLAKRGDVLLELSKDGTAAGTLLVSSHVLALASPVFDAMFNGSFTEGQDVSAASPKKIALPDDDPKSIVLFCRLVHMQTKDLVHEPSFEELADLAIVCDKYHCTESMRSWLRVWITKKLASPKARNFEKLIFVTYVCDLPKEFEEVTLAAMRDRAQLGRMYSMTHGSDYIPLQIVGE